MSKIVIFGITGYAGRAIASELLDRGRDVVGVARNPGEVAPREHLQVRSGSVHDPALLREVAQGAEAIVLAIRVLQDDGTELAATVPALLKAAAESGARIGVVGGAASLLVAEGGPRVIDAGFPEEYRAEAEAHGRVLEALQSADTTVYWFYVSPRPGSARTTRGRGPAPSALAPTSSSPTPTGTPTSPARTSPSPSPTRSQSPFITRPVSPWVTKPGKRGLLSAGREECPHRRCRCALRERLDRI
jgi:uncharacterized protein